MAAHYTQARKWHYWPRKLIGLAGWSIGLLATLFVLGLVGYIFYDSLSPYGGFKGTPAEECAKQGKALATYIPVSIGGHMFRFPYKSSYDNQPTKYFLEDKEGQNIFFSKHDECQPSESFNVVELTSGLRTKKIRNSNIEYEYSFSLFKNSYTLKAPKKIISDKKIHRPNCREAPHTGWLICSISIDWSQNLSINLEILAEKSVLTSSNIDHIAKEIVHIIENAEIKNAS
jgi:hypothetical protein